MSDMKILHAVARLVAITTPSSHHELPTNELAMLHGAGKVNTLGPTRVLTNKSTVTKKSHHFSTQKTATLKGKTASIVGNRVLGLQ